MKDPKTIALAKRVKAGPSSAGVPHVQLQAMFREETGLPHEDRHRQAQGRTRPIVETMDCHPGHPDNMMSREQFAERFRVQAAPVLQGERAGEGARTCCATSRTWRTSPPCPVCWAEPAAYLRFMPRRPALMAGTGTSPAPGARATCISWRNTYEENCHRRLWRSRLLRSQRRSDSMTGFRSIDVYSDTDVGSL